MAFFHMELNTFVFFSYHTAMYHMGESGLIKDRGYLTTDFMRKRDLASLPVLSLIICYR